MSTTVNPRKELRRISREALPHLHVFAIIMTVGLVLAPFTFGIGLLLALAVGAIYMAYQTSRYEIRVAGAREAYIRTAALARQFPEDKKVAKFARARGKLLANTLAAAERSAAKKAGVR